MVNVEVAEASAAGPQEGVEVLNLPESIRWGFLRAIGHKGVPDGTVHFGNRAAE